MIFIYGNIFCKRLTAGLIFQLSPRILSPALQFSSHTSSFGELIYFYTFIYYPCAGDPQVHPTQTPMLNNRYIQMSNRYVHLNTPKQTHFLHSFSHLFLLIPRIYSGIQVLSNKHSNHPLLLPSSPHPGTECCQFYLVNISFPQLCLICTNWSPGTSFHF